MVYYILKQKGDTDPITGATVYAVWLDANDTAFIYESLSSAQADMDRVKGLYPGRGLRIQAMPDMLHHPLSSSAE
jgi:hypothetical protein